MQQRASVPPPGLPRLQVRAGSQQSVDHGRVLIVQGCPHRGRVLPALLLTSMRAPARQKDHCAKHLGEPAPRRWPRRRQHRGDERQRSRRQRRNPRSTSRRARDTIGHQRLTLWAPAPAATRAVRPHLVGTTAARDRRHSPRRGPRASQASLYRSMRPNVSELFVSRARPNSSSFKDPSDVKPVLLSLASPYSPRGATSRARRPARRPSRPPPSAPAVPATAARRACGRQGARRAKAGRATTRCRGSRPPGRASFVAIA